MGLKNKQDKHRTACNREHLFVPFHSTRPGGALHAKAALQTKYNTGESQTTSLVVLPNLTGNDASLIEEALRMALFRGVQSLCNTSGVGKNVSPS